MQKRTAKLQQPDYTRFFVTIPLDFIRKLRWLKGEELDIQLEDDRLIIKKKG